MNQVRPPKGRLLILFLALLLLLRGDAPFPRDFWIYAVDPFVHPYLFDWWGYESTTILQKIPTVVRPSFPLEQGTAVVEGYFDLVAQMDGLRWEIKVAQAEGRDTAEIAALEDELARKEGERQRSEDLVEEIVRRQIETLLIREGITWELPWGRSLVFPPVEFEFQESPLLLIISPRERIETLDKISLLPTMKLAQMEEVERQTGALGVSSLVEATGGMGSYPPIIPPTSPLPAVIGAAIHEWVHNYLFFYPLGQHYPDSQELITMNETVASLVEEELSLALEETYYPEVYAARLEELRREKEEKREGFDFNREMREIRLRVDELLAQGKVEEAEAFMEERRKYLVEQGYYIRKLNQAYFAFHGSYATGPASVSPIGGQLKELRQSSPTLAHFLKRVARMSSYQDLLEALSQPSSE